MTLKPAKSSRVAIVNPDGSWRSYAEMEQEMREEGWIPAGEYAMCVEVLTLRMSRA